MLDMALHAFVVELRKKDVLISQTTTAKYMRELGLQSKLTKKFKVRRHSAIGNMNIDEFWTQINDENKNKLVA